MRYTLKDITNSLSSEKKKEDSVICNLLFRPVSYLFTYVLVNLGFSAWAVSFISTFVIFSGCVLFSINNLVCQWIGIGLIFLWNLLDCVDGNIARIKHTQGPSGEFMDASSGYVCCALIYFSIGIATFSQTNLFGGIEHVVIILGAIASISDLLSRLIFQKYRNSQLSKIKNIQKSSGKSLLSRLRKRISSELGIAGLVPVIMVFCLVFTQLFDYVLIFYSAFNFLSAVFVFLLCSVKSRGNKSND